MLSSVLLSNRWAVWNNKNLVVSSEPLTSLLWAKMALKPKRSKSKQAKVSRLLAELNRLTPFSCLPLLEGGFWREDGGKRAFHKEGKTKEWGWEGKFIQRVPPSPLSAKTVHERPKLAQQAKGRKKKRPKTRDWRYQI